MVLRENAVRVIPIGVADIAALPLSAVRAFAPGSVGYWIVQCGLVVAFTYVWTAVTFSSKNVLDRIKRYRFTLTEPDSTDQESSAAYLDRTVERMVLPYAVFLAALT